MTKTRQRNQTPSQLEIPMPNGFFTDMPHDCIRAISEALSIFDAGLLAIMDKRLNAILRQTTTRRYLQEMSVVDIVRIGGSTFCITQGGWVFAAGDNAYGQLGIEDVGGLRSFELIPNLSNIKQIIKSGEDVTLFIANDGKVFASGGKNDWNYESYPMPFIKPSSIPKLVPLGPRKILKAEDDGISTCFLTREGKVYVLGKYNYGELGIGRARGDLSTLKLIRNLPKIRDLIYTGIQLYLLTENNFLYVCGRNDVGQLGLGDNQDRSKPILVPQITDIKTIQICERKVYALTHQGQVYAWGDNTDGMLGFDDQGEHNTPTLLPGLSNIVSMTVKENRYFVTKEGAVYCFGPNQLGELGFGDKISRRKPALNTTLSNITNVFYKNGVALFTDDANNIYLYGRSNQWDSEVAGVKRTISAHDRIEQVVDRISNGVWRTRDGAIYVAGGNWDGELGVKENFCVPTMVLFQQVKKIIRNASVADLLFYSASERGYSRYCYQLALKKIRAAKTAPQLLTLLHELNSPGWSNSADIKPILPAYHLVLRYINNPANQQQVRAVLNAWAQLLIMYRDFASQNRGDTRLREFMAMLNSVTESSYSPALFQPPVELRSGRAIIRG